MEETKTQITVATNFVYMIVVYFLGSFKVEICVPPCFSAVLVIPVHIDFTWQYLIFRYYLCMSGSAGYFQKIFWDSNVVNSALSSPVHVQETSSNLHSVSSQTTTHILFTMECSWSGVSGPPMISICNSSFVGKSGIDAAVLWMLQPTYCRQEGQEYFLIFHVVGTSFCWTWWVWT